MLNNIGFIDGAWTYRSFLNNPDASVPFNNLEFATAAMTLKVHDDSTISGQLDMGESGSLNMKGRIVCCLNDISHFEIEGYGVPGTATEGWVYSYYGFIIPKWSQGVNQVDAMVGSVVRSADHGSAKAGKVASFYMVRKG
ncbi:MAG: hypothetical protein ABI876_00605 [Bacteroidota bacterium]